MRTYALYGRQRWVLGVLVALATAVVAVGIVSCFFICACAARLIDALCSFLLLCAVGYFRRARPGDPALCIWLPIRPHSRRVAFRPFVLLLAGRSHSRPALPTLLSATPNLSSCGGGANSGVRASPSPPSAPIPVRSLNNSRTTGPCRSVHRMERPPPLRQCHLPHDAASSPARAAPPRAPNALLRASPRRCVLSLACLFSPDRPG